jgi:hypothetical protein
LEPVVTPVVHDGRADDGEGAVAQAGVVGTGVAGNAIAWPARIAATAVA